MTAAATPRAEKASRAVKSTAQRDLEKATADLEKLDRRGPELQQQHEHATAALADARRELATAAVAGSGDTKKIRDRIQQLTGDLEDATSGLELLKTRRAVFERNQRAARLAIVEERRERAQEAHRAAKDAVDDVVRRFVDGPLARALEDLTAAGHEAVDAWTALQQARHSMGQQREHASTQPLVYRRGQMPQISPLSNDLHERLEALIDYCAGSTPRQQGARVAEQQRQSSLATRRLLEEEVARDKAAAEALVDAGTDDRVRAALARGGRKAALLKAMDIVEARRNTGVSRGNAG